MEEVTPLASLAANVVTGRAAGGSLQQAGGIPQLESTEAKLNVTDSHNSWSLMLRALRNAYGLVLNAIGFQPMLDRLVSEGALAARANQLMLQVGEFVQPFAEVFFKEHSKFQSHHSFIVRYRMGEDLDLKTHTDDGK